MSRREKEPLPAVVRLEASTLCQLNCRACDAWKDSCGTLGKGYLRFSDFRDFIRNNSYIKTIEMSNRGEIFLNPELTQIMKFAFENDIALYANAGVNFNTISDEVLEALVKYQFRSMVISIDGASQEVYSAYRVNGNFDTVIENIRKLNANKRKHESRYPELFWQYILMEHNEDDVVKAKEMAYGLQMKIYFKLTWEPGYIPGNVEMLRRETGFENLSREEVLENEGRQYLSFICCNQLWTSPQINWDGRLLGCCVASWDDFGVNVFETGLEKAIRSKNFAYAKKMLKGEAPALENVGNLPCASCSKYEAMKRTGIYIDDIHSDFKSSCFGQLEQLSGTAFGGENGAINCRESKDGKE